MVELAGLPVEITEKLRNHRVTKSMRRKSRVFTDTTNFTAIDYGDIILVAGRYFLVTAFTREGRFGVDDQIKPWVPRVQDLATGEHKILKLVFHETFDITFGPFTIPCYRNPEKKPASSSWSKGNPILCRERRSWTRPGTWCVSWI